MDDKTHPLLQDYSGGPGWSAYEKLVLDKLDSLDSRMTALENQQVLTRIDVAMLKVKSGMWGALAGAVPAIAAVMFVLLNN